MVRVVMQKYSSSILNISTSSHFKIKKQNRMKNVVRNREHRINSYSTLLCLPST